MILLGNFQHTLDDKNRIRLPAKFREVLGANYILTPGTNGCIYVYSIDEADKIVASLGDLESSTPERLELVRTLSSESATADADSQGRFTVAGNLLTFANINNGGNVRIVGAINKVEIWSEERWLERSAHTDNSHEGINKLYHDLYKKD